MLVRRAVEFDQDTVQGSRVIEFGADKDRSDFLGHGGDSAVHTQTVVLRAVAVTKYDGFMSAYRTTGGGCAAADIACVRGNFNLNQRPGIAVQ